MRPDFRCDSGRVDGAGSNEPRGVRNMLYDRYGDGQLLIDDLKAVGLDGIEAIYSTYTTGEEQLVKRIAKENDLLISGGSDFHGENKPAIKLGTGRGHLYIPYSVLTDIKARAGK